MLISISIPSIFFPKPYIHPNMGDAYWISILRSLAAFFAKQSPGLRPDKSCHSHRSQSCCWS